MATCPHCNKIILLVKDDGKHGNATPPARPASAPAGLPEDIGDLLEGARLNASGDWEETFVADQLARYKQYGENLRITEKQLNKLRAICEGVPE